MNAPRIPSTVIVKVRLPTGLVDRIDALCKQGKRAELIRDVLADRIPPTPGNVAAERLTRAIIKLEQELDTPAFKSKTLIEKMAHFGAGPSPGSTSAAALRPLVLELTQTARELRAAIVDEMLANVGYRRRRR